MWRLRVLTRREWLAIVLGLGALGFAGYASLHWRLQSNAGFGPGWHCTYPGKGDPICIKDSSADPSK